MADERSISIEVVYRGIFQKTLAQRITRSVVLAARKDGHTGTAFARYGDSPERNGVPAKQFAVVAADEIELEASMAKYEPAVVDVSIVVDDTLVKGDESAVTSVQFGYESTAMRPVKVGEGTSGHEHLQFEKPGWTKMRPGIVVDARKPGERNPYYKKYGARTMRPVVNFDTCIKCTMCWLDCPDECFEVTPEGHYEVVYEACIGCGICAQVCPVKDCIVMVDELKFTDNTDKWQLWKQDHATYNAWFEDMSGVSADPKKGTKGSVPPNANPAANPATSAGGDE